MEVAQPNYGLTKSKQDVDDEDNFISPLPRAVLRPNNYILLDGEWKFALDPKDEGLSETWQINHKYDDIANWPGSIEDHMAEAKGEKAVHSWQDKIVVWYEREFPLPKIQDEDKEHCLIQLTFGACGYETTVWLNGIQLRTIEGEDVHIGEYTSFSYELKEEILLPLNRITIRIEDTMDADIPRGKQESNVYKRGGIWYQTYSGGVRSIWLEVVERNRLRSRLGVVSIVEDNVVRFNVTTRIHDPGNYTLKLNVYDNKENEDKLLATDQFNLTLEAGQKQQRVVLEVPGAELWSPENPKRYLLVAQLIDENKNISEIVTKFGLRKIEARGCCVYLNNKAIYIDGILYQPASATYEQIQKHMYAMKELGCNLVRIHISGVDPRIYNLADKIGIMLWVEVPSPHQSTTKSRQAHRDELIRMLALIETHPSVVIWSLYNEDWGIQDIETNPETRKYIIDTYNYMELEHPQFLVIDNDGWRHISYEGRLKSDILTAHLYTPDIEKWKKMLDDLLRGENNVTAYSLVIGDPFFYRKQVPLIVSEWGGFGFINYGGPNDSEQRTLKIKQFKKQLRKRAIAGDVYTQATNIEDERNGIIDAGTGILNVPAGLLKSVNK